MKHQLSDKWLICLLGIIWIVISILFTQYNAGLYQETVVKVLSVSAPEHLEPKEEQVQELKVQMLNGSDRGRQVTMTAPLTFSGAVSPAYHKGDQLFVNNQGEVLKITNVKRDRYVLIIMGLFLLSVWWVGKRQGALSLASIGLNVLLLILGLTLYLKHPQLPLALIILITGSLTTTLSLIFSTGWSKKTLATVVGTLGASIIAWLVGWLVLNVFHDKGLRYEEMQFLTRPYRQIFIASLFLGTLGAAMDIAITVVSTIMELLEKNPAISTKELIKAGQNVGKNVMGSMASVLLFAYLSGGIPTIILYLKNGWDFGPTIEMTLSLEIARALVGGIGIVLTIPLSVLVVALMFRKRGV